MQLNPPGFAYSALPKRPQYTWRGGARMAVYVTVNVEHFPYGVQSGPDLDRPTQPWGQRSWLWREYGNRIGAWRLLDLFDELELPVGVIANTAIYDHCPEVLGAHVKRGDELISHGRNQAERQIEMTLDQERVMIDEVTQRIARESGARPVGWMSPYLTPSANTTELIAKAGYSYCMDWGLCDEQPFWVKTADRDILAMPYPIELNDQPAVVYRRNTAAEYEEMLADNFDELARRAEDYPLVFAISIHTFILGQPYRLTRFRRALQHILRDRARLWVAKPQEIASYYETLPPEVQLRAG
ncbi:MAG TPA: polysaccharide deacetylase [Burkholderiales bacterium]|nr:polysaccharide deacetylase [Burkholderiales bacterium]